MGSSAAIAYLSRLGFRWWNSVQWSQNMLTHNLFKRRLSSGTSALLSAVSDAQTQHVNEHNGKNLQAHWKLRQMQIPDTFP